jgi:TPR repeat protein
MEESKQSDKEFDRQSDKHSDKEYDPEMFFEVDRYYLKSDLIADLIKSYEGDKSAIQRVYENITDGMYFDDIKKFLEDKQNLILSKVFMSKILMVEKKYEQAFLLLNGVYDSGDGYVFTQLAIMYKNGYYVRQNLDKAKELLEKGCRLKCGNAFNILATMYYHGEGVIRSISNAIALFEEGYKCGSSSVCNNFGNIYLGCKDDDGNIILDFDKAISLLMESEENCSSAALFNIALTYDTDSYGKKRDRDKAIYYYKRACNLNIAVAFKNLYHLYRKENDLINASEVVYKASLRNIKVFNANDVMLSIYHLHKRIKLMKKTSFACISDGTCSTLLANIIDEL